MPKVGRQKCPAFFLESLIQYLANDTKIIAVVQKFEPKQAIFLCYVGHFQQICWFSIDKLKTRIWA